MHKQRRDSEEREDWGVEKETIVEIINRYLHCAKLHCMLIIYMYSGKLLKTVNEDFSTGWESRPTVKEKHNEDLHTSAREHKEFSMYSTSDTGSAFQHILLHLYYFLRLFRVDIPLYLFIYLFKRLVHASPLPKEGRSLCAYLFTCFFVFF